MTSERATRLASAFDWGGDPQAAVQIVEDARRRSEIGRLIMELLELVTTGDTNAKVGGIEALGIIDEAKGDAATLELLIGELSDATFRDYSYGGYYSDEDDMRSPGQVAARVLGRWKIREAIPALISQLSSDLIGHNGVCCIDALIEMKANSGIPVLERLRTSNEVVRWGVYSKDREVNVGELANEAICKILEPEHLRSANTRS